MAAHASERGVAGRPLGGGQVCGRFAGARVCGRAGRRARGLRAGGRAGLRARRRAVLRARRAAEQSAAQRAAKQATPEPSGLAVLCVRRRGSHTPVRPVHAGRGPGRQGRCQPMAARPLTGQGRPLVCRKIEPEGARRGAVVVRVVCRGLGRGGKATGLRRGGARPQSRRRMPPAGRPPNPAQRAGPPPQQQTSANKQANAPCPPLTRGEPPDHVYCAAVGGGGEAVARLRHGAQLHGDASVGVVAVRGVWGLGFRVYGLMLARVAINGVGWTASWGSVSCLGWGRACRSLSLAGAL